MKKALAILGTWALTLGGIVAVKSQSGSTQASAPPDHVPTTPPGADCLGGDPLCKHTLSVPANPLAYAELLQNEAAARWQNNVNNCIVGAPYGEGHAHAARAQVLDTAMPAA